MKPDHLSDTVHGKFDKSRISDLRRVILAGANFLPRGDRSSRGLRLRV